MNFVGVKILLDVKFVDEIKLILDDMEINKGRSNVKLDKVKDELGDNLIILFGYRKMIVEI